MVEITKVYRQDMGARRFIGKKYGDSDRVDGGFGAKWGEWFANDWFAPITKNIDTSIAETFEDAAAQIGLMSVDESGNFQYWIGLFTPVNTSVPDGYQYVDFPKGELGVCWVYGKEGEVYMQEGVCGERLTKEGHEMSDDWCFERYVCPRFTTPDDNGNIILDICFFAK